MDRYVEYSTTSWGARLKSALGWLILGPILIVLSVWLTWWNEGESVRMAGIIASGQSSAVSVSADTVGSPVEGRLVHVTGKLIGGKLLDRDFWLVASGVLLSRDVEMYQWQEKKETKKRNNVGGSETTETIYTYKSDWSRKHVSSSGFRHPEWHSNPTTWPVESRTWQANQVLLGARSVDDGLVGLFVPSTQIPLENQQLRLTEPNTVQGNSVYVSRSASGAPLTSAASEFPIGDVRFSYSYLPSGTEVSMLAEEAKDGSIRKLSGERTSLTSVYMGKKTLDEMFQSLATGNAIKIWLIRVGGFILMLLGWGMFFSIIPMLAMVLPFLWAIANLAVGTFTFIISLVLWGVVFAVAWFNARPVLSLIVLVGAIIAAVLFRSRSSASSKPSSPTTQTYAESPPSIQDFTK